MPKPSITDHQLYDHGALCYCGACESARITYRAHRLAEILRKRAELGAFAGSLTGQLLLDAADMLVLLAEER